MSKKPEEDNKSEHNEQEEKLAQLDKEELDKIADEDEEDLKQLKEVWLPSQLYTYVPTSTSRYLDEIPHLSSLLNMN